LHSQIAAEENRFNIDDVIGKITRKMIDRHPHVFAETKVADAEEVVRNWERSKQKQLPTNKSILDGVPRALPALHRAQRISEKAARIGFEWTKIEEIRDKVSEELQEFLEACLLDRNDNGKREEEFGDLLFSLVQLARRMGYEAENMLNQATNKFVTRFKGMEALTQKPLQELSLEEMDKLWEQVKKNAP